MRMVLEVMQGRWANQSGRPVVDVIAEQLTEAAAFVKANPSFGYNWRPDWSVSVISTDKLFDRPRKGYERYDILADGTLGPMQANWDSGD